MRFSIITPCYNGSKHIERFFSNIKKQTFQDFEIVIIDDGSIDNSASIIDNLITGDNKIVLIKQDNKGPSMARINGINNAKGEYVLFLDIDDALELNALEIFNDLIDKYNDKFDILAFYHKNATYDYSPSMVSYNGDYKLYNKNDFLLFRAFGLTNRLFKRPSKKISSFFLENNNIKTNEDYFLSYELFKEANIVCNINISPYIYYENFDSTTHTHMFNPKRLVMMEWYSFALNNLEADGYSDKVKEHIRCESIGDYINRLVTITLSKIQFKDKKNIFLLSKKTEWYSSNHKYLFNRQLLLKIARKKERILLFFYKHNMFLTMYLFSSLYKIKKGI